jgi:glutathione-independent formaldehyde dehydrogenase
LSYFIGQGVFMASNRGVVYEGVKNLTVQNIDYPKLEHNGKPCHHGAIVKVIATNICGSDQHIYRGRFSVPLGTVLGHEITGEVIELGSDVEFLNLGDLVSVPFNVSCGRCRNCKERHPDVCLNVNDKAPVGAYGFDLGGWQGGQSQYVMVPYADYQLLKFPDKAQAMEKILDLTFLSDILPTGYHGCVSAGVTTGSTVYIAGAGPVGRAAAASAQLLGAAVVIVGDTNSERLAVVRSAGFETVDLTQSGSLPDKIAEILNIPEVDCGIDCVGYEAHGRGLDVGQNIPQAVLNDLIAVVRAGGKIGVPGIYVPEDPEGVDEQAKHGSFPLDFGKGWLKSLQITTGMAPVSNYNRQLMMAILHDRIQLSKIMNIEVIQLDLAPQAYADFDAGSPKKYVIDPFGSLVA